MKYFIVIILFTIGLNTFGQNKKVNTFYNELDTSIVRSVKLDPEEDVFTSSYFAINSGLYKFPVHLNTLDYGFTSRLYMMQYNEAIYEADTTPLLNAKYDHGYTLSHWFTADFSRKIGNSILISKFNRSASKPWYENPEDADNKTNRNNFLVGAQMPFNKNYTLEFHYCRNQTSINETGGIKNIDSLETVENRDQTTIFPNLTSARSDVFRQKLGINQKITFWQKEDSLKNISQLSFLLNTSVSENRFSFEMDKNDIDSGYFSNILLDSTNTFDSIGFKNIRIEPKLAYRKNNNTYSAGYGMLRNDLVALNEHYVTASFSKQSDSALYSANLQYNLEGSWRKNWDLALVSNHIFKSGLLKLGLNIGAVTPDYPFVLYSGNHFNWNVSNYKMTNYKKINTEYIFKKINLSVHSQIQLFDDYIYFNELSIPIQHSGFLLASKTQVNHWYKSKWLDVMNGIGLQTSSNQDIISVPTFYSKSTVQFKFKYRAVPFRIGTIVHYFSTFKGQAYNPTIWHFYQSNTTVGGTPIVDGYFAARMGPADLYVKYDNFFYALNRDLLIGEDYPISIPYLRFGLNWRLRN